MKTIKNVNFSLKETINSESATTVLKTLVNQTLKVNGLLVAEKQEVDEETGESKTLKIGVLKTTDGQLISSISPTVTNSIESIINAYTDGGLLEEFKNDGVEIKICSSKSSKGRDFFFLELV